MAGGKERDFGLRISDFGLEAGLSPASHPKSQVRNRKWARPGFTFIEILATLMFLGIVLPTVMAGISLSLSAADTARRKAEAGSLAHGKLMELVALGQTGQAAAMSGDFAPDFPDYQWTAQLSSWSTGTVVQTVAQPTASGTTPPTPLALEQLDVTVTWLQRGQARQVTLSTLVTPAAQPAAGGTLLSGVGTGG